MADGTIRGKKTIRKSKENKRNCEKYWETSSTGESQMTQDEWSPFKDLPLFQEKKKEEPHWDGHDIGESDTLRLKTQMEMVKVIFEGCSRWLTVDDIHMLTDYPHNSISAQIRNLRKERFGKYPIVGRYRKGTKIYEYKLIY